MGIEKKAGETEQQMSTRLAVVQKILELMTAAFSFVAALAWNDAIQELFKTLFPLSGGLAAKFLYALGVTAIIVWIGVRLSRITKAIEKRTPHNP